MSFLFKDDVLAKLLIDSGIFNSLNKYGQQVNDEAKLIAVKLTKNLLEQANEKSGGNDLQIYVQNLVDLDSYLNFLVKNGVRDTNEKLIVYHDASGASPPADAKDYVKYKEFYVLKDALLEKLRELDVAANQVGNEVMKPLVKGLIEQINAAFGSSYESQAEQARQAIKQQKQNDGSGGKGQAGGNTNGNGGNQNGQLQNVKYDPNDPNAQNVSNKDKTTNKASYEESLKQLLGSPPFQSDDELSPYAMHMFIGNAATLVSQLGSLLKDDRLSLEMSQRYGSIGTSYAAWNSFVSGISSNAVGGANAMSYQTVVPYDRARRPFSTLESIFGSQFKAKEATQRLLQMVLLVQQTLASLKRSPDLSKMIGANVLDSQLRQAKAYIDSLTGYAR